MKQPLRVMLMVRELGPGGTERQITELARSFDRETIAPHVGYFREVPAGCTNYGSRESRCSGLPVITLTVQRLQAARCNYDVICATSGSKSCTRLTIR